MRITRVCLNNEPAKVTKGKPAKLVKRGSKENRIVRLLAHDLRNPISGIWSASEYLLEDLSDVREEHVALLRAINSSSRFTLQLIDDILESAAIEPAENRQFQLQPTDLVFLVKQILAANRMLAESKLVQLDLRTRGEIPLVPADLQNLYQVIDKLVGNAIKYSYPHSRIEITIGLRGARAILTVRDHGEGIADAEELKSFLKQRQEIHQSGPGGTVATGGLPFARQVVEGHGGSMTVESSLGKGSTFTVSLPLKPSNARQRVRSATEAVRT